MKKVLVAALLIAFLAACSSATQEVKLTSYELPANVDVIFNALAPENGLAGEPVLFAILDDVTGLEYNPQLLSMQASGERSYAVTISVPAGTLLKYRYTRQSAAGNVDEISAAGQPITYREYLVDGPGHVANDLIAAWSDTPTQQPGGQISGLVTAAGSGQPLAGMVVSASGIQTNSDADGHFVIGGLPQGLHNIVVSAPDGSFLPFQQGALIAAGSETQANIQLSGTALAAITFHVQPASDSASAVPTFLVGDLTQFDSKPQLNLQSDGSYLLTLQLPAGLDIRYKYTLGDGFWNAEHAADGSFVLRQLVIPSGTTQLTIDDQVAAWASGASAAIWFDLIAPAATENVYLQFKLLDWEVPLRMWALGGGHFAYVLYSPTNFAAALEYRYCLDSACTIQEAAPGQPRSVAGNQPAIQQIKDIVEAWQGNNP
jgi:hypothetical protein